MKTIFLIFSALTLFSCKEGSNKTSAIPVFSAYEQRAFLVIPYNEDTSILREKLLHLKLSSLIKADPGLSIDNEDQFKIGSDKIQLNKNEKRDYNKYKTNSAEVVVSFNDRTEIYFVPAGLLQEQALLDLHLKREEGEDLSWAPETPSRFMKGETYYLLSSSKEELLINDQNFSFQKMDTAADTKNRHQFSRFQKLVIHFQIDYFAKETSVVSINAPVGSCTKDMREAGMCECIASLEQPTGRLTKTSWSLDSFGLALLINGKEYQTTDFRPQMAKDKQSFMIIVDLSKLNLSDNASVQFIEPRVVPIMKQVSANNKQGICRSGTYNSTVLDLTPVVNMTYQMDVYGRDLKI